MNIKPLSNGLELDLLHTDMEQRCVCIFLRSTNCVDFYMHLALFLLILLFILSVPELCDFNGVGRNGSGFGQVPSGAGGVRQSAAPVYGPCCPCNDQHGYAIALGSSRLALI